MRLIRKSLVLIAHVCSATIQASPEFDTKAIDEYIESKMRLPRIPGLALAIVKDSFGTNVPHQIQYNSNLNY